MITLERVADILKEKDYFLILGHIDPDGDCIGSIFALKGILDKMGKRSIVLLEESPVTDFEYLFDNFFNTDDFILFKDFNINQFKWPDFNVIALDSAEKDRLGQGKQFIQNYFCLNLDHHIDNPGYGDFNHVDSSAAAVGQIIFDLSKNLEIDIDKKIATAIITAIISDTGSLRYQNTTANVLRIVASLVEQGADLYQINRYLYGKNSFKSIKLKGLALTNLNISEDGKIAWLFLSKDMLDKVEATDKDTDGLVNYARDIKGVEVGISFKNIDGKETKVSLRSNEYCAVNEIAAEFGGGGHPRAAGCILNKSLNNSIELVLDEVKKFV